MFESVYDDSWHKVCVQHMGYHCCHGHLHYLDAEMLHNCEWGWSKAWQYHAGSDERQCRLLFQNPLPH